MTAVAEKPTHTSRFSFGRALLGVMGVFLALGLAGVANEAKAAIGFVHGIGGNNNGVGTTLSLTLPTTATGNTIIVGVRWNTGTVSVSDSAGNLYATAVGPIVSNNGGYKGQVFYASSIKASPAGNTVTLTGPGGSVIYGIMEEWAGLAMTSALDQTASSTDTNFNGTLDSGTVAITQSQELLFGFGISGVDATFNAGTNYALHEVDGASRVAAESRIANSSGSYNATMTASPSSSWWTMILATFKAAPPGIQVSSRSDTLSDPRPSATSNHTIAFTTNTAIYGSSISGSSTLTLTLPSGFTIPVGMDCGDVDAATSVQFSFNYPGCAATATAWGFSATGSSVTLVPPSGTGVYVPTSTQVTIKIGSNATVGQQGAHWITNPSTGGVYTIAVGGTFGGSGNMLVSINAGVSVQATVAESLSFTVSPSVTSIKFVQANFTETINNTGALASFGSNNAAGNLIVIALDWDNQAVNVLSVTDTKGNVYAAAAPPVNGAGAISQWRDQIFYAKNIGDGANTVNVEFSGSVHSELYIHEYSGADQTSPLDVTASSIGNGTVADSGSKTTNFPNLDTPNLPVFRAAPGPLLPPASPIMAM
jgi:hypothetical protein